jgi:hypothetical protein
MMKKPLAILLCVVLTSLAIAQVQDGYLPENPRQASVLLRKRAPRGSR